MSAITIDSIDKQIAELKGNLKALQASLTEISQSDTPRQLEPIHNSVQAAP